MPLLKPPEPQIVALIPAAAFCLVILKRVRAEDAFLQGDLAGYSEYTGKVRGQLFPRIVFRRRPPQHSIASDFASHGCDRGWR